MPVKTRLEAAEHVGMLPSEEELRGRIALDAGDLQSRLALAELGIARADYTLALSELLEITRRDRIFRDDIGRRRMLAVFDMAAVQPDLVADFRNRLSQVLF